MQGNPQIIAELNKLLKNELTAINQYFLHARMMGHWGFERMAKKIYEESIGEMKHADKLMKRILVLDGLPNLQDLGRLGVGETVVECLRADLRLETEARTALVAAVTLCESTKVVRPPVSTSRSACSPSPTLSPIFSLWRSCRFGRPSRNRMRLTSLSACFISPIDSS